MHAVLGRQLRDRQLAPNRLQRHLRLELGRIPLALPTRRGPSGLCRDQNGGVTIIQNQA